MRYPRRIAIQEEAFDYRLDAPIGRGLEVAALEAPIPFEPRLEDFVLPNTGNVVDAAKKATGGDSLKRGGGSSGRDPALVTADLRLRLLEGEAPGCGRAHGRFESLWRTPFFFTSSNPALLRGMARP